MSVGKFNRVPGRACKRLDDFSRLDSRGAIASQLENDSICDRVAPARARARACPLSLIPSPPDIRESPSRTSARVRTHTCVQIARLARSGLLAVARVYSRRARDTFSIDTDRRPLSLSVRRVSRSSSFFSLLLAARAAELHASLNQL